MGTKQQATGKTSREEPEKPSGLSLDARARELFEGLGYDVSVDEPLLRAERDDKVVQVTPVTDRSDVESLCPYQWEDDK
ncbi:MAG: hypothetical protein SV760_10335, partial [Halobacteria archaeon]|nr:hypothetical protein [Halobacteria archaeon]